MRKPAKNHSSVRIEPRASETPSVAEHCRALFAAGRDDEAVEFILKCIEEAEEHIESVTAKNPEMAAYFPPTSDSVH